MLLSSLGLPWAYLLSLSVCIAFKSIIALTSLSIILSPTTDDYPKYWSFWNVSKFITTNKFETLRFAFVGATAGFLEPNSS